MRNNIIIKKIFAGILMLFSIAGITSGIIGARAIFTSINPNQMGVQPIVTPFATNLATYLFWIITVLFIAYIIYFKEKKINLFWILLSFFGVLLFSFKKLIGRERDKEEDFEYD